MEISASDLSRVAWRKSSLSGSGQNCIEVGIWRKSSRSNANGGQCVEIGVWHKSAHSGNGPDCVEVALVDNAQDEAERGADAGRFFLVRDSKVPGGPVLAVTPSEWGAFLNGVKGGRFTDLA